MRFRRVYGISFLACLDADGVGVLRNDVSNAGKCFLSQSDLDVSVPLDPDPVWYY